MSVVRALAVLSLMAATALAAEAIAPFSTAPPGDRLPVGWRALHMNSAKPSELALVPEDGVSVLRVRSNGSAGAAAYALHSHDSARRLLSWRWKVDRVVEKADLTRKDGDDFAARVYVFFDVRDEDLPWRVRLKLRIARLVYGSDMPSAAICYVWDNRHAVGTSAWNPYTDRVRTVVLESGNAHAGQWIEETRDVAADYRAAFESPRAPPVEGIAAGNDTDQTGESVTAWFGDFRLREAPGAAR